jgi:ArsR family transcriptional regulator
VTALEPTLAAMLLLGDANRLRLLALLEHGPFAITDLVQITGLAQSRVSSHIAKLRDAGIVDARREGGSTLLRLAVDGAPAPLRALWDHLRPSLDDDQLADDRRRAEGLLAARRGATRWPEAIAGEMERHYSPGRTWHALAHGLVGLLRLGDVLDIGAGDGAMARLLAPRARSLTCLDRSERLLEAARSRLQHGDAPDVRLVCGDMHALPFPAASFDQVLLFHVLTYAEDPAVALREAARVLRPGGDLVVLTLAHHDHAEVARAFDHVHPGFEPARVERWLADAGLAVNHCEASFREKRRPHFSVLAAYASKPHPREDRPTRDLHPPHPLQ